LSLNLLQSTPSKEEKIPAVDFQEFLKRLKAFLRVEFVIVAVQTQDDSVGVAMQNRATHVAVVDWRSPGSRFVIQSSKCGAN